MGRYDSFFACDDTYPGVTVSRGQATTSGDQTLAAGGTDFLLTGAPDVELNEGQIVSITDGGGGGTSKVAYCRVMKRTTSPSQKVKLLPVQSTVDSAGVIGLSFKSGATITGRSVPTDVLTLVIDLSGAPPATLAEPYTYVLAVAGSLMSPVTSNGRALVRMLRRSLVGDPLGGAGSDTIGDASQGIATGNQAVSPINFVCLETTLTPGQRYEFRLLVGVEGTTLNSVRVVSPRIWAARVATVYSATQVAEVTTTATAATQVCATGAVIPAGTYLVLASWMQAASHNAAGDTIYSRFRLTTAATNFFRSDWSPISTSEYNSRGFAAVMTLGANEEVRLNHGCATIVTVGLTTKTKHAYVYVVQFASQAMQELIGRAPVDGTNASLTADAWNTLLDSDQGASPQTLAAGTWVEFLSFCNLAGQRLRPDWSSLSQNEPDSRGFARLEDPGTVGTRKYAHFFMSRHVRPKAAQVSKLLTRTPAATTSQGWLEANFSFIRETARVAPRYDSPVILVAEIEVGVVLKRWTSIGSDKWQLDLQTIGLVSRVTVNGTDYTEASTVGGVSSAQTWFWDVSTRRITIKMDASDSPADADRTVLLGAPYLVGRESEALLDDAGVSRQFVAQMRKMPAVKQSLDVKGAGCEVATSFGKLSLLRSTRDFDDLLARRVIDGMRVRVYRGWRHLTTRLRDCQRLLTGTLGRPRLTSKGLDLDVHDASLTLKRPVATTTLSIYEGATLRADKLMPVIYGTVRRVPAYRTTNAGTPDTYRVTSAHQVKNIGAINSSGAFTANAYKDGEVASAANAITVTLSTASFTLAVGQPEYGADVLYVDVQGITDTGVSTGTLLTRPGEIARHVAVTYGGYAASDLVDASFRLLDRTYRQRRSSTGALVPLGVNIGLYLTEQTVADALSLICQASFSFWGETRSGRLRVGVPDTEAANLLVNGSWESDSVGGAPWQVSGAATIVLSTTVKFFGARSAVLNNGASGWAFQRVIVPSPGAYLATCLASLQSGIGSAFRIGVITPDEGLTPQLSAPTEISSAAWSRVSVLAAVPQGGAGSGQVVLLPYLSTAEHPDAPGGRAGLDLWLDASTIAGKVHGDAISQWDDISGNGNHATQGTAAKRATFAASAIAGHAAIRFDGKDDALATAYSLATFGITVFVVYRVREWNDLAASQAHRVVSGGNNWLIGPYGGTHKAYVGSFTPTAGAPAVEPYRTVLVTLKQTSSSSSTLYVNGTAYTTNATASQVGPGTVNLGAVGGVIEPGVYDVAELIVFSQAVGDNKRMNWEAYLMRKWGISAVAAAVDIVRAVPIGMRVDATVDTLRARGLPDATGFDPHARNAVVSSTDLEKEVFYEARVPYNVNNQKADRASAALVTDSEARGLLSSYDPVAAEGRAVLRASGRLDMGKLGKEFAAISDLVVADAQESAFGVAAAEAFWFGRQRTRIDLDVMDWETVPEVGTFLFAESVCGVPRTPSEDPLWLIVAVDDASDPTTEIAIEATREMDPVADRDQISPTDLPLGALLVCTASACPTDYEEVATPRGFYIQGGSAADLVSVLGAAHHQHELPHTHALPAHQHVAATSAGFLGASFSFLYGTPQAQESEQTMPQQVIGPSDSFNDTYAEDPHSHSIGVGNFTVNLSGTVYSGAPAVTLRSHRGANDVKHINVIFCRKIAATITTIPASIVLGHSTGTAPSGWTRQASFYDRALRGADAGNTGFSGRTIGAHTQTTTGAFVTPSSMADIFVAQRITVTEGGNTYHGIVTAISGATFFLVPSHETGDTACDSTSGTSYSAAATIAAASCDVGTTVDPPTHLHVRSGANGTGAVEGHQHTVTHDHVWIASGAPAISGPDATVLQVSNPRGFYFGAYSDHQHEFYPTLPALAELATAQSSTPWGGTLTDASANLPARFAQAFINNAGGTETVVPVGARILWDGAACPSGYTHVAAADGRLIIGAPTGAGDMTYDGGHVHSVTFAAHAYSHNHGGSFPTYTGRASSLKLVGRDQPLSSPAKFYTIASYGFDPADFYHAHAVTVDGISTVNPTLAANASTTTAVLTAGADMPLSRRLILCQRD